MAGRDPASTFEPPRRLPLAAPAPPRAGSTLALPGSFQPRILYTEARATVTIRREGGSIRPPILVEESGCRIGGLADERAYVAVIDDPDDGTLGRFAKMVGAEAAPLDSGDTPELAERALSWTGPIAAGMDRWEKISIGDGERIVDARWEARVDLASVRVARRACAPLPAAPDEGPEAATRSQDRSLLEVRLHLKVERAGRCVDVESARWADPGQRASEAALAAMEGLWPEALVTAGALFDGVSLPSLEGPVVFSPAAAGVLIHEVCGHLLEGDLVRAGHSPFSGMTGRKIAPEGITLHDDPLRPGARVDLRVDDQGEGTRLTPLIESGRLVGFLTDRRNAAALGILSSGNARRESYRHAAMPRMTNLVMAPGTDDPAEMLRGVGRGLYVERLGRGQVDPRLGRFRLEVECGRLIESGRATRPVHGGYLVGGCLDLLEAIDAVGSDQQVDPGAGVCIKEDQIVPVGQVFPSLRVSKLRILPGAAS
jgi:predicted Zn-dependent protease